MLVITPTKLMDPRSAQQPQTFMPGSEPQAASVPGADPGTGFLKAQVAGSIVVTLQERRLTARAGAVAAGIDAADIQRIRNLDLTRFTLDRLVRIAHRLGHRVEVAVLPSDHTA